MENNIIKALPQAAMLTFVKWTNDERDTRNPVFIAQFKHPIAGEINAYAKIYEAPNRGLVNEITGYLFCNALNVPQPKHAFLAQIELKYLPKSKRKFIGNKVVWAFCTSRLDGDTAAIHITQNGDPLLNIVAEDITNWTNYPDAVTTDEKTANIDRHLNNLIRLGTRKYAVIDNGILVDEHWIQEDLLRDKNYENQLFDMRIVNKEGFSKLDSRFILSAQAHSGCYSKIEAELGFWYDRLLSQEEKIAFMNFLKHRSENIECLIRQRTPLLT